MEREKLGSRLGFILLSAGCAIGMGNVWKFPYMVGQYGGAIFVLFYFAFLILLGLPIIVIEFAMGRASQKSPVKMYQELEPKGTKWHIQGYVSYAANWLLMMFYTAVTGWMVYYCVNHATGKFVGMDADTIGNVFGELTNDAGTMTIYSLVVIVLGFGIISFGVQKGLEKVTKVMMIALLALLLFLAAYSCTLEGGAEGIKFYLLPSIDNFVKAGTSEVVVGAMNQAFFTLSLGIGSMAIFGSYIGKERSLMGESISIIALDTLVAIVSGLIIFPSCASFGVDAGAGPSLIFITLPNIFANMQGGRIIGTLFFIFMSFAALSTILAVYENILAMTMELFNMSRKKAALICGIAMFVLTMPCILGFNKWSGFQPLGEGTGVMDLEDFLVSNIALPLGSLCYVCFAISKMGWGWDNFIKEANTGEGIKFPRRIKPYLMFVIPIIIIATFIIGLVTVFS